MKGIRQGEGVYLVFRCPGCGRHLYTFAGNKTRKCICGRTVRVDGVTVLARCTDERDAGEAVRRLQAAGGDAPAFVTYRPREGR